MTRARTAARTLAAPVAPPPEPRGAGYYSAEDVAASRAIREDTLPPLTPEQAAAWAAARARVADREAAEDALLEAAGFSLVGVERGSERWRDDGGDGDVHSRGDALSLARRDAGRR